MDYALKVGLLSLLLMGQLSTALVAQVYQPLSEQAEPGLVTISFQTGGGLSTLVGPDVRDSLSVGGTPAYKAGLTLGVVVVSQLRPHFWLAHECWLQQQGAVVSLRDEKGQSYASRLRLQYLNVYPVNVTWVRKQLQMYAGPYVGMVLSASLQRKDPTGQLQTDPSVYGTARTLSGAVTKIDAGLCVGMDYSLTARCSVGWRVQQGMLPVWQENTLLQNGQARIYTQNGTVNVRYQLSR